MRWRKLPGRMARGLALLLALGSAQAAGQPGPGEEITARLEQALAARYRSPAEARRLNAELREALAASPDPTIEATTWLNDCRSLIEEDGQLAAEAARRGREVLAGIEASTAKVLAMRLEVCEFTAHEYLGLLNESLEGYDRLLERAEELGDSLLRAEILMARGDLRSYGGRIAEGLHDLQAACRIFRQIGLQDESLVCLQSIAVLYYRVDDHDRAIEYLQEVIPERERRGQTHMLSDALYNLARAQQGKGDVDNALINYERSSAFSRELGNTTSQAYTTQAIGALRLQRGEAKVALPLFDQAIDTFRRLQDRDMTARVLALRGEALQELGRAREAIAAAEEAVALYREIEHLPGIERSYTLLADLLLEQGSARRAAETMLLAREVHEQLDVMRRDELLAAQRAEFDAEKKEQSNRYLKAREQLSAAALEDAQRIDRLKTVVILLSALLLLLVLGFLLRQMRLSRRLRALAMADELTGIGNRRSVLAFLEEQIRLHRASAKPLSVILLDIDRFKLLNDQYGHAAGDEALKAVAGLCQQLMRGNDKLGRTGGEEFLAVLPGAPLTDAGDVALRLCEQVRQLALDSIDPGLRTSVSVGVSQWRPGDEDAHAVIKRADEALYRAKAGGRDRVEIALD